MSLSFASAEIYTQTYDRENNKRLVQVSPTYSWADQRLREHDYPPALLRPEFRNAAAAACACQTPGAQNTHQDDEQHSNKPHRHTSPHRRGAKLIEHLSRKCADGRGVYVKR